MTAIERHEYYYNLFTNMQAERLKRLTEMLEEEKAKPNPDAFQIRRLEGKIWMVQNS